MNELDLLNVEIGACTICRSFTELAKHNNLQRGNNKAKIMVVGLAPGKTENTSGIAFSGNSGKQLIKWLMGSGIGETEQEIREVVYFTSLVKCSLLNEKQFYKMYRNCRPFLLRQLSIIQPKIIIPLGPRVFNALFLQNLSIDFLVGKSIDPEQLIGFFAKDSEFKSVTDVVPFPHPSGRNRWVNSNRDKLEAAKQILLSKVQGIK